MFLVREALSAVALLTLCFGAVGIAMWRERDW